MKKIVALVLAMVMALSLATVAFAVPLWTNGGAVNFDIYDAKYNTKKEPADGVTFTFHAAVAPDYTKHTVGNIAYWECSDPNYAGYYVMTDKWTSDTSFAVKVHNANIKPGATDNEKAEGAAEPLYFMTEVTNVSYIYEATAYTAWGTLCEQYAKPADADKVTYVQYTAKLEDGEPVVIDAINAADVAAEGMNCVLVNGVVYGVKSTRLSAIQHSWAPTAWAKDGKVTTYTCQTCKTVAKVIESMYVADKTKSHVQLSNGDLIEFSYTPGKPGTTTGVNSAKTFDAGIAMYVGMSLLSVAGGAVVIGKKKEF